MPRHISTAQWLCNSSLLIYNDWTSITHWSRKEEVRKMRVYLKWKLSIPVSNQTLSFESVPNILHRSFPLTPCVITNRYLNTKSYDYVLHHYPSIRYFIQTCLRRYIHGMLNQDSHIIKPFYYVMHVPCFSIQNEVLIYLGNSAYLSIYLFIYDSTYLSVYLSI
jgi:hypothetical protein